MNESFHKQLLYLGIILIKVFIFLLKFQGNIVILNLFQVDISQTKMVMYFT